MTYIAIENNSRTNLFGEIHLGQKKSLFKEIFNSISTDNDNAPILQEIKSQTFNNLIISNKNS